MKVLIAIEPMSLPIDKSLIKKQVRRAILTVAKMYEVTEQEVSITLTNNEYIRELNRTYRGIDRETDVLSFALNESNEPEIFSNQEIVLSLGDIIISMDKVKSQALEYGHSEERELTFLLVHGMLHLLGYDHIEEVDRLEMETEQRAIMNKLGILR